MSRDVIGDRYGRYFEIPEELARRGHQVRCLVASYHGEEPEAAQHMLSPANATWHSIRLKPPGPRAISRYWSQLKTDLIEFRPEVLIAGSDAFHVIGAQRLGSSRCIPVIADLYDQYEAYGASHIPGVRSAFRSAVGKADAVLCVSNRLRSWAERLRPPDAVTVTVPNAVRSDFFSPMDIRAARSDLGLPHDGILLGTAGALYRERDIQTLYGAFLNLARADDRLHLVVAGPRDQMPPSHPRIHDLGMLEHSKVAGLFNAINIGIVCNRQSLFAAYCHPQKLVELLACNRPTIVADTLDRADFDDEPLVDFYVPGDVSSLANAIVSALAKPRPAFSRTAPTWADRALEVERVAQAVLQRRHKIH